MATAKRARIFLRRGTDADRQQTVLCEGELGYSVDGKRVYVGDGNTEGGVPLTATWIVGSSFDLATLNDATAAGKAEIGDFAVKTPATTVNISDINAHYTGSAVLTINSNFKNLYTLTDSSAMTWMSINSGIPISNIDIPLSSLSADQIHGGAFSGSISFSDSITADDTVFIPGVADSARGGAMDSNDNVYALGITNTGQITAIDSLSAFDNFSDEVNTQRNYFYDYLGQNSGVGTLNDTILAAAIATDPISGAAHGSLLFITNKGLAFSGGGNGRGSMQTTFITQFILQGTDAGGATNSSNWYQTSYIYNNGGPLGGQGGFDLDNQYGL